MAQAIRATQTVPERAVMTSAKESVRVMAIESKDLVDRLNKVYDDIASRAFNIFENDGRIIGRDLDNWFKAETELFHPNAR